MSEKIEPFNIDELRSTETDELPIVHPATGQPTTWVWTLAGPGHPKTIEQSERQARDALRLQRQREQAIVNRKKWIEPERSPDEIRDENARSFAARVLGWTPARINGDDYPFSQENAVKLLLEPAYGRIYVQLLEHFTADASFTQRSVKN
jgi:hypothetical protein